MHVQLPASMRQGIRLAGISGWLWGLAVDTRLKGSQQPAASRRSGAHPTACGRHQAQLSSGGTSSQSAHKPMAVAAAPIPCSLLTPTPLRLHHGCREGLRHRSGGRAGHTTGMPPRLCLGCTPRSRCVGAGWGRVCVRVCHIMHHMLALAVLWHRCGMAHSVWSQLPEMSGHNDLVSWCGCGYGTMPVAAESGVALCACAHATASFPFTSRFVFCV